MVRSNKLGIYPFYFFPGCEIPGEGAGASGGNAHAESVAVVMLLLPSCQKSGNHGVSCAYGVYQGSLRGRGQMHAAIFGNKHGALTGHGDKNIPGAPLLKPTGVRNNSFPGRQGDPEKLPKLVIVWLNQERLVAQYIEKQLLCGVHHKGDTLFLKPFHNVAVNRGRHGSGDGACQNQRVLIRQRVQLFVQGIQLRLPNCGANAVNFGAVNGTKLQINAGNALRYGNELGAYSYLGDLTANLLTGEPGDEAESGIFDAQILENNGDIDALAPCRHLLGAGAVRHSQTEILHIHNVVQRGVEGDGVDRGRFLL